LEIDLDGARRNFAGGTAAVYTIFYGQQTKRNSYRAGKYDLISKFQ
jgi:hypothetical protein